MKKRWIATLTTYEPSHKSSKWGSRCIEIQYTNADLPPRAIEIPRGMGLNIEAIERAEKTGEIFVFFQSDIDYSDLSEKMPEDWF